MKFKIKDGIKYALALRLNVDNDEFYYDSPLWTNNELLNVDTYTDEANNSKYRPFISNSIDKLILELNGVDMLITLPKEYPSLKDLFLDNTLSVIGDIFIKDSKVSPFNINRNGYIEQYNVSLKINYKSNAGLQAYCRICITLNDLVIDASKDSECGSFEGVGIKNVPGGSQQGGHLGHTHNKSAGIIGWDNCGQFYGAKIYVPHKENYLIKQQDKLYGINPQDDAIIMISDINTEYDKYGYKDISDTKLIQNLHVNGNTSNIVKIE